MKSGLNAMPLFLLNDLLNISDEKGNHIFWTQFCDSDHSAVVCLGLRSAHACSNSSLFQPLPSFLFQFLSKKQYEA